MPMIELTGLIFALGKEIYSYVKGKKTPVKRLVGADYVRSSGLLGKWEALGYEVKGVTPKNQQSCEDRGWEVLYGYDSKKKEIFYLELEGGTIYIGKKKDQ